MSLKQWCQTPQHMWVRSEQSITICVHADWTMLGSDSPPLRNTKHTLSVFVTDTKHTLSVFVIDTKHTSDCHLATVLLLGYDMPLLVSSGSEWRQQTHKPPSVTTHSTFFHRRSTLWLLARFFEFHGSQNVTHICFRTWIFWTQNL